MSGAWIRGMAPGERALAAEMFGSGLDAGRLRIASIPLWNRAFVAGPGLMVWPRSELRPDFGAPDTPLPTQATFVHELTHVWQAQNGVRLLIAKLKAGDSAASYAYDLGAPCDFARLNIEQQAMVVEHAFLSSRGVGVQHPPEAYASLGQPWRRA